MITLKNVLHPTDFSPGSEPALNYACSIAARFNATLHIINIVEDPVLFAPVTPFEVPPDYHERRVRFVNESLAELPQKIVDHAGEVVRNVCIGKPITDILRYADEHNIDMIVMGTHGYTGLEHVLMGSVAEKIVRSAVCPVLTVRAVNARPTTLY